MIILRMQLKAISLSNYVFSYYRIFIEVYVSVTANVKSVCAD